MPDAVAGVNGDDAMAIAITVTVTMVCIIPCVGDSATMIMVIPRRLTLQKRQNLLKMLQGGIVQTLANDVLADKKNKNTARHL